jgi:membrane-bound metal-dependent hydrolase YbcI (DUF457 family)
MPLPIAHGLIGASIVGLIHPKAGLKNWLPLAVGFVLGNAPDFDFAFEWFLGWRGFHRGFFHSLFFAFLVAGMIFFLLRRQHWRIPLAYSLAFLSHTILDYSCSSRGAVRILIPFDNEVYGLGLISFSELKRGLIWSDMLHFTQIEIIIFVPLFALLLFIKHKFR